MQKRTLKSFIDFIPVPIFFVVYKFWGLIPATAAIVICTIASTIIHYMIDRKIAIFPLISAGIICVMGGITIFSQNTTFIKMKPTIVNLVFAIILVGGNLFNKNILKAAMGHSMKLPEAAWKKFAVRWAYLFLLIAIANEIIWRNFPEAFWVNFKVFGILSITIVFMLSQISFLSRYLVPQQHDNNNSPPTPPM